MPRDALVLAETDSQTRGRSMLASAFGPVVQAALGDPTVTEILLNPDGRLWTEREGHGLAPTPHRMTAADAERIIRLIATHVGQEAGRDHPIVSAELPGSCERFEGLLPPVAPAPCFVIRKPAAQVIALEDYITAQVMTPMQAELLRAAVELKRNILIIGGTASGKTTLANALLGEIAKSSDRLLILEDTRELKATSPNVVQLKSSDTTDLRALVRSTLRLRPDRIIIGEVRGSEALELLKAWNTGHTGGIATCHANSARAGLLRLEQLCLETITTPPRALIAEAVQVIVVIDGRGALRRIRDIALLQGLDVGGDYRLQNLVPLAAVKDSANINDQFSNTTGESHA
jgi:type IV secretion system protein TrbB